MNESTQKIHSGISPQDWQDWQRCVAGFSNDTNASTRAILHVLGSQEANISDSSSFQAWVELPHSTMVKNPHYAKIEDFSLESIKRYAMSVEIEQYKNLPDGWDDAGGHAPDIFDIKNALAFMQHIPEAGIYSAELMVAGDGDVGYYWKQDDRYLEVGFQDENISFYGKTPEGNEIGGDEVFDATSIPLKLQSLMKSVLSD